MSVNDVLTIIVALAAVVVSIVALVISNAVDERATRTALTDLAVKINQKAIEYQKQENEIEADKAKGHYLRSKEDDHFVRMKEIEMLVGQADFLVCRIKPGFFARRIPQMARRPRYPVSNKLAGPLLRVGERTHLPLTKRGRRYYTETCSHSALSWLWTG